MALKVWLPLNGTLDNIGISDITMNGTPASWGNGKIGKCATFTGNVNQRLTSNQTNELDYTDNFSWCMWVNPNYTSGSTQYVFTVGRADATTYGYGANIPNATSLTCRFGNSIWGVDVASNEWTHVAFTKQGTSIKIYRNGELKINQTFSGTLPEFTQSLGLGLGCFYYSGGNIYPFFGSLNDFRIYDHCLSAKEVKEVSQGLVLHYKLNELSQGSGNNLVTGLTKGGQTTVVGNIIVTSGENADTYFKINLSSALILNKSYTIGIDAENLPDGGYFNFPIGAQNNTAGAIRLYNGHNELTFVANDTIVNCGTSLMMDDNARTAWPNQCIFKNFYIYENVSITDSSGYGNNGTITGTLSTESDSNRYEISTHYPGSSYTDTGAGTFNWFDFSQCTLSAWIKSNASVSGWSGSIGVQHDQNAGHKGFTITDYANNFRVVTVNGSYTTIDSGKPLTVGEWHHCAAVLNGTNLKMYYDGAMVKESTVSWGSAAIATDMRFATGVDFPGSNEMFNGNYSDVRMYCTALSAEDILDLYHTPANIDNLGRLHGFEFVENDEKDSIYKNGIISNGKNINYLVNNFAETNTLTDWSVGGTSPTLTNGILTLTGTGPAINSSNFTVNPDDIIVIEIGVQLTQTSTTSGPGIYLGTKYGQSTSVFSYNFTTNNWVAGSTNNTNPYFMNGYNSTDYYHCKTYLLGSNKTIDDIPDAKATNTRTLYAIKLNSDTTTNIRSGYNQNTEMVIKLSDFKIYNLNQHGIAQVDNSKKTGYGYLQYNNFIEK